MFNAKTAKPITPIYASVLEASSTTEIRISKKFTEILTESNHHLKARVFWGINLFLLALSKNKPEEHVESSISMYRISFLIDPIHDPDFIKVFSEALTKHFQPYSRNARVEIGIQEDGLSIILLLPTKVINENWENCIKPKITLNNPDHRKELLPTINKILTDIETAYKKCNSFATLSRLNDLHIENEILGELMQLMQKQLNVNIFDTELVRAGVLCKETIHHRKVELISIVIDSHFNIPDRADDKPFIIKLIANCILKKTNLIDFLRYKTRETHEIGRPVTDNRVSVYKLSTNEITDINAKRSQHAVFIIYNANEEYSNIGTGNEFIIEVSHYDPALRIQAAFANNASLIKLDLHGFNAINARKLTCIFLARHFNSFTRSSIIIDVGKASHSPNNISRLAPPMERLLSFYQSKGIIEDFDPYDQSTGHIVIYLPFVKRIRISSALTESVITSFKPLAKFLPGVIKIQLKELIKSSLKNNVSDRTPIRLRIQFARQINDNGLMTYLEENVILQQITDLFLRMQVSIKKPEIGDSFCIVIHHPDLLNFLNSSQTSTRTSIHATTPTF